MKFRYTVTSVSGSGAAFPLGAGGFRREWTLEDNELYKYSDTMPSRMKFTGATFQSLLTLENSNLRCQFLNLSIERECGGVWAAYFTGSFTLNDAAWDLDRCEVDVKLTKIAPEQCFTDGKSETVNLFELISDRRTVRIYAADIVIEKVTYSNVTPDFPCTQTPLWLGTGTPQAGGWIDYYNYNFREPVLGKCNKETRWTRYKLVLPATDPAPGAEWILILTSGGFKTWVKPAALYDCIEEDIITPEGGHRKECKILGDSSNISKLDNGLALENVLAAFAAKICTGITVKSQFFQINPDTVTATNYVTGAASKVRNIVVFQKSDVKRPGVSGNATKLETSFEAFINQLCNVFNVRWRVIGSVLRVEHISWFPKNAGLDLTLPRYALNVKGLARYSYKTDEIPPSETFKFMEASAGDFAGVPITYGVGCVSEAGRATGPTTIAADQVTTDLELCLANPSSKSDIVDDKGMVFIAASPTDMVLSEPPILSTVARLNNPLAWAQLHRDYYRHYRPLKSGIMNNTPTDFLSVRPTKKGVPITVPFCCGDAFNPDDVVATPLGDGTVEKAVFDFKLQTLTLDLLYPSDEGLYTAPQATNDIFNVNTSDINDLDVLANDIVGSAAFGVLEIVSQPAHGVCTVIAGPMIRYTVGAYLGPDEFTYRVKDINGFASNNALVALNVLL
jgi:hypothetical protein